jgi:hypothetical protein
VLNKDINSRFEDWLRNPSEALDFEVKGWLDMDDLEDRGKIAKALIALENHGGGFLLIGYEATNEKRLVPKTPRPASLDKYNTDLFNAIVKKCAEPAFHVDVTLQRHPETGDEFPLVLVRGTSRTPVRSDSETTGKSLRNYTYYIRRPGPSSESPQTGAEWDALVRRCVLNQRTEIVELLRSFIPAVAEGDIRALGDELHALRLFCEQSYAKWQRLNAALPDGHPSKNTLGTFSFACQILGNSKKLTPPEILQAIQSLRKYTGWPILDAQGENKSYLADGCIETWLANQKYPDRAHADFWRVHPDGFIYLLRGYQEDALEGEDATRYPPGTGFELTLPVWRLGEFLLRVEELGRAMFEDGFTLLVRCAWRGLKGRRLIVLGGRRFIWGEHRSQEDVVVTKEKIPQAAVNDLLPDIVKRLTSPLYAHFDFFQPPDAMYAEDLERMRTRQY